MKDGEIQSLCGSEVGATSGSCYAELLSLQFFRRAIRNYGGKKVDTDIFGPLVRNIYNEKCVFDFGKRLAEELKNRGVGEPIQVSRRYGTRDLLCDFWCDPMTRSACKQQMLKWCDELIEEYQSRAIMDALPQRFAGLQKLMRLSDDEMEVLKVLWLMGIDKLEEVNVPFAMSQQSGCIALYTGLGEQQVRQSLRRCSRLSRFGCIERSGRSTIISTNIRYYLDGVDKNPIESVYYRRDEEETLPVEFFGDLAKEHLPILKRMLAGEKGRKLNILLYGAPGTGKTSFARALAKESGRIAYMVQQRPKDSEGEYREALAEIRYAAVEICDEQTDSDTSMIIVDEADSLLRCQNLGIFAMFGRESSTTGDKGLLNDVLERVETPTVWIANTSADELDPSNRRRFDYAIRFEPLTTDQRVQIWRNAAQKAGVAGLLDDGEMERLAKDYPVNAGVTAKALENLGRIGAGKDEAAEVLTRLLDRQCELSGTDRQGEEMLRPSKDYSTEGLNIKSSIPLEKLEGAVRRFIDESTRKADSDAPRMNILLTGVPGSGKTEFVKHLAATLGRPLMMRRASDLKSMWVGGTEKKIAAAFREAREKKAILFFDEVDTFLDNREGLRQGHEKSMVNEVLQQMESFGGVFIGTTNFKDGLDPAVARRFTFKVELDYLDHEGRRVFWRRFFGSEPTGSTLERLDGFDRLTPGDFRTVRQELYYLGEEVGDSDRLEALERELAAKGGGCSRIGFNA